MALRIDTKTIRRWSKDRPSPEAQLGEIIRVVQTLGRTFQKGDNVWFWDAPAAFANLEGVPHVTARLVRHVSAQSSRVIPLSAIRTVETFKRKPKWQQ